MERKGVVGLAVATGLMLVLACSTAAASETAVLHISAEDACGGAAAEARLAGAMAQRLSTMAVRRGGAGEATLRWTEREGQCGLVLDAGGAETRVPLAADAGDDALAAAASRLAWLAERAVEAGPEASAASAAGPEEQGAPDPETEENTDEGDEEEASEEDREETEEGAAEVTDEASTDIDGEDESVAEDGEEDAAEGDAGELRVVPVGLSVMPGVNAPEEADETAVRQFSFTLAGSRTGGLDGLELGLLFNRVLGDVRGAQLVFGANIAEGELRGAQFAMGVNVARGEVRGLQAGAVNVASSGVRGLQTGSVNVVEGDVRGVQHGMVNVTNGRVRGLQLGFVNVADRSSASIGLVNVMREEPVYGLLWGDSDGTTRIGLQHGSQYFRQVLAVGVTPLAEVPRWSIGGGFGGHIPFQRVYLEVDLLLFAQGVFGEAPVVRVVRDDDEVRDVVFDGVEGLAQLRLQAGIPFGRMAVYAGVGQNMLWTRNPEHDQPWSMASAIAVDDPEGFAETRYVYLWPAFHLGLRF